LEQELIPEKMPGRKIVVPAALDIAAQLAGVRFHSIGIPILKMRGYTPPTGPTDGYAGVRKWYRKNIEDMGNVCLMHRSDVQRALAKAQADAVDYLVTEDAAERAKHKDWCEPDNEAIEIAQWLFPANAVNKAIVRHDFNFEIIIVSVTKNERELDRVYYFVNQQDFTITYSHHFRGKRPAPKPQS
jgi:hypothetical protein